MILKFFTRLLRPRRSSLPTKLNPSPFRKGSSYSLGSVLTTVPRTVRLWILSREVVALAGRFPGLYPYVNRTVYTKGLRSLKECTSSFFIMNVSDVRV